MVIPRLGVLGTFLYVEGVYMVIPRLGVLGTFLYVEGWVWSYQGWGYWAHSYMLRGGYGHTKAGGMGHILTC